MTALGVSSIGTRISVVIERSAGEATAHLDSRSSGGSGRGLADPSRVAGEPAQRPASEPATLRIRLLGGFSMALGEVALGSASWRGRAAAALLKLLALSPTHALYRDEVIDLLWPDEDPETASARLRLALHAARRVLRALPAPPQALVQTRGERLLLYPEGPLWIDVEAFEAAAAAARRSGEVAAYQAAIDLYAGDLLPEERYEDWTTTRRESLRGTFLGLLLELADLHERDGEYPSAIAALERAVGLEPALEDAHACLMRLFALTGRRQQALRQYRRLRDTLRRELDVAPDPATQSLYLAILSGTFPAPSEPSSAPEPAAPSRRDNLPVQLTSFVGRQREKEAIAELLVDPVPARLLTLTGVGGCGKTRLALAVASELVAVYPDGVWLIELGALTDPAVVPETVAATLGVEPEPRRSSMTSLVEGLRSRRLLLLLDNCEHLIDACAQLAMVVLAGCPGVQILATSREPLRVSGERVWRVPPLELPDLHRVPSSEDLYRSEAVRLFCERAALVQPDFTLSEQRVPLVTEICRRLEGLPLAIELAAARLAALTLEQLAQALGDPLRLLAGASRTPSPRQRTLRATLDWSYALLSEPERALLRRLAVFAGGGTLAAIESVVPGSGLQREQVWDLLFQLVEKSLVVTDASDPDGRYRLLETVRQYAAERLAEAGEVEALRARHATCYLALAEEAEPALRGPEQSVWFARLEREHHNLRAALARFLERREAWAGLRLAGALWWFWYMHAHYREGSEWLTRFLALARSEGAREVEAPVLAKALLGAAVLLWRAGALRDALARCDASLALYRRSGDQGGAAWALVFRAHIASAFGDQAAALAALEESVALFRRVDDPAGLARALNSLGDEARLRGDDERAAALYEEALVLDRVTGHRAGQALRLHNLGYVALHRGDLRGAAWLFGESLALHRELGHPRGIVMCIEGLAATAALAGKAYEAARLHAAAGAERERLRASLDAIERLERERLLTSLRSRLDAVRLEDAQSAGHALSLAEAVGAAEQMAGRLAADQPGLGRATASLSRRERQIAALIARGLTNRAIATELGIAQRTVDTHVGHILGKLGVPSRAAVAAWAREQGLVEPPA